MIYQGDLRVDALKRFEDNTFHGVFCDPPYEFGFMGRKWDSSGVAFDPKVWAEMLRVCRPGAALLAFGGPRTFHRLTCAIEDGGWEIRDCLMYLYGTGFPKSLDISKALDKAAGHWRGKAGPVISENVSSTGPNYERTDKGEPITPAAAWKGYGSALKPAFEPIILARKPLEGTMVENVTKWQCGPLAIDACRVGDEVRVNPPGSTNHRLAMGNGWQANAESTVAKGRWPANLLLDEAAGQQLDLAIGNRPGMSGGGKHKADYPGGLFGGIDSEGTARGDNGGPSRFFYSSKVSTKEREAGCERLPKRSAGECTDRSEDEAALNSPRSGAGRTGGNRNHHPTLKPLSLTEYLARLILPPMGGKLLVPFAGTGSEYIGATKAGWDCTGIELDPEYIAIANARIAHWIR